MPKLIKVSDYGSGQEIFINTGVIFAIWRPQPIERTTLKSVSGHEHIRETPETVVSLIGGSVPLIKLNSTEGFPVWVNTMAVFSVFQPPGSVISVIKSISMVESVVETPDEIVKLIGTM